MTGMGHEDRFPPSRLNGSCRFSQGTFAGTRANGRDAPIADFPALTPNREVRPKWSFESTNGFERYTSRSGDFQRRCQPRVYSTNGPEYEEIDKLAYGLNRRSRRCVPAGRGEPFLEFLIGKLDQN